MQSNIKTLLNTPDNAVKIRDQIAAILKCELLNQYELAQNENIENQIDYNIKVYVENSRPWMMLGENPKNNPFPLINISIQETKHNSGGTSGKIKYTGTFLIDCYGCGNYQPENAQQWEPDDKLAAERAWHNAGVTRNILMSGFYTYLGMQPIVQKRNIESITAVVPTGIDAAIAITACRIKLNVEFFENSPEADGVLFNGISFKSNNDGEVNLINMMSDNDIENK